MNRWLSLQLLLWFLLYNGGHFVVAQINFSKYLQENFVPGINPEEYVEVSFKWNMPGKTQTFMNEGLNELKENNYDVAFENFKEVNSLSPDFWPAYYYAGVCKKATGQLKEAEKKFQDALKISRHWETYHQLGDVYQLRRNFEKAREHYEIALDLNEKSLPAIYQLGNLEFAQSNVRKALRYYEKCNELDRSFPLSYVMQGLLKIKEDRKNRESLTYFDKALDASPTCKEALFWRGFLYINLNETKKALTDWDKLIELNPDAPFFRIIRAYLQIEMKDYELAFNDFRKAITSTTMDQDNFRGGKTILDRQIDLQYAMNYAMRYAYGLSAEALTHFKKGFCYLVTQDYPGAIAELRKAERVEDSPATYFLEGLTFEYMNYVDSSMLYYDKALKLDNDIFDAHKKRGLFRYNKKDWRGAYGDFAEMIRIQPELIISYRLRGLVKFEHKDFIGSMLDFKKYLDGDSTDVEIIEKRGISFFNLKDYKNAIKDFTNLVNIQSDKESNYSWLGYSYLNDHDTVSAMVTWNKFIDKFPDVFTGYTEKANVLIQQKKWPEALIEVDKAINTLPVPYHNKNTMSDLLFFKGYIYFNMEVYDQSIEIFSKSLKEDNGNVQSKYYRGKAYLAMGKKKDAQKDFKYLADKEYLDAKKILETLN